MIRESGVSINPREITARSFKQYRKEGRIQCYSSVCFAPKTDYLLGIEKIPDTYRGHKTLFGVIYAMVSPCMYSPFLVYSPLLVV